MAGEDDKAVQEQLAADKQADADLEAGMAMEATIKATAPKPEPKPEAKPEAAIKPLEQKAPEPKPAAASVPPPPKYVQLTEETYARLDAAANRTAALEQQLSKAFGTIGNLQKVVNSLQSDTPRGFKVEIPKDAFAEMEKEFPELARHTRAALEATLRGVTGTGPANAEIDPEQLRTLVGEHAAKLRMDAEREALDDAYPDWRVIVGQVDASKQAPDPNNSFRKWLAGKDATYQARINGTNSAAVLSRAIQLFQAETKAPVAARAPNLKAQLRAARIHDAVQPRGDGGQPPTARSDDDEFQAGFASR